MLLEHYGLTATEIANAVLEAEAGAENNESFLILQILNRSKVHSDMGLIDGITTNPHCFQRRRVTLLRSCTR